MAFTSEAHTFQRNRGNTHHKHIHYRGIEGIHIRSIYNMPCKKRTKDKTVAGLVLTVYCLVHLLTKQCKFTILQFLIGSSEIIKCTLQNTQNLSLVIPGLQLGLMGGTFALLFVENLYSEYYRIKTELSLEYNNAFIVCVLKYCVW